MSKKDKLTGGLDSMIQSTSNSGASSASSTTQELKNFNIYLPVDMYKQFCVRAIELGLTKREYIKRILQYELEYQIVK